MLIYDRLICICRPTTPPSFLLSFSGNSFLIRYNNTRRPIPFMDNSEIIGPIFFCFLFSNVSNGDRGTAARGKQNTKNYGAMLNNLGEELLTTRSVFPALRCKNRSAAVAVRRATCDFRREHNRFSKKKRSSTHAQHLHSFFFFFSRENLLLFKGTSPSLRRCSLHIYTLPSLLLLGDWK